MTETALEGFQLSPQQTRILKILGQGTGLGSWAVLRFTAEIEASAVRAAVEETIERHEILRTIYPRLPGMAEPVQVIVERQESRYEELGWAERIWEERDLAANAQADPAATTGANLPPEVRDLLAATGEQTYDAAVDPPLKASWLSTSGHESYLVLILSPLAVDAPSLDRLMAEICDRATGTFVQDVESEEILQYADYAQWQAEAAADEEGAEGRAFWSARAAAIAELDPPLVAARLGRAERSPLGHHRSPERLDTARLEALASELDVTLEAVLLAAWRAVLGHFARDSELTIVTAFDGRHFEELQDAVGLFLRYLPVSSECLPSSQFNELAAGLGEALATAALWQDDFDWHQFDVVRGQNGELPAFGFELLGAVTETATTARLVDRSTRHDRLGLCLSLRRCKDGLEAALMHDERFGPRAAEPFLESFVAVVKSVLANPRRRLDELELMSVAQRRRLIEETEAAGTSPELPPIHRLIAQRAVANPGAPALVQGERVVTYGELVAASSRLAALLAARGVGAEQRVALLFERSPEMVVAVLAVFEAGGALVALHPSHPPSRLTALLDEARPRLILYGGDLAVRLPQTVLPQTVPLVEVALPDGSSVAESAGVQESREFDPPSIDADQLAYLVYTSGSSGRPKGVAISHRGVTAYLRAVMESVDLEEADTVLQLPDLIYDAALRDLLAPLAAGARVVLLEEHRARDPQALLAALSEHRVSVLLSIVPTLLRALLAVRGQDDSAEVSPALRALLSSGEVLRCEDVMRARDAFGSRLKLINQYGPTECTMTAGAWPVPEEPELTLLREDPATALPVGRPLAHLRFLVLDRRLRILPVGMPGELFIGGAGLARGYLGRPSRTASSFLPDPFAGDGPAGGGRLFRTGDLVAWRPDRQLEFLGRLDEQVKWRGVRVEPGEIEARLREHPAVSSAVALVRTADDEEDLLVAYVELLADSVPPAVWRDWLRGALPETHLPAMVMVVEKMPLTISGKIDRSALPEPRSQDASPSSPRELGQIQELTIGIMARVLGRPVGLDDDFFALGGHSLLATQVILRLNEILELEIPLQRLWNDSTPRALAGAVEEFLAHQAGGEAPSRVPLRALVRDGGEAPLSSSQQRLWFHYQLAPEGSSYNTRATLIFEGDLRPAVLEAALREILRRHEILRTRFALRDDGPVQIVEKVPSLVLPRIDLGRLDETRLEEEDHRVEAWTARAFDLEKGPLARFALICRGNTDHVLAIGLHHIASDAWSIGVLMRELALLYGAGVAGAPSPLPRLEVQYSDYAVWQREAMNGAELERLLSYWRGHLGDELPTLHLPFREDRPATPSSRGAELRFELPASTAEALESLRVEEGVTLFMVLLAALETLLYPYAPDEDMVVGTHVANRLDVRLEPLIGFFVNTLVLRTSLSGDPTFRELLARVRRLTLAAYGHQELPFDKLVEELGGDLSGRQRIDSHSALFQVLFVLQNIRGERVEFPDLRIDGARPPRQSANFDLLLIMFESEEGLAGLWNYRTDLFEEKTIARFRGRYVRLLERVAENPGLRLSELVEADRTESGRSLGAGAKTQVEEMKKTTPSAKLEMFAKMKPQAVRVSRESLVDESSFNEEQFPLVLEPKEDLELLDWAKESRDYLEDKLQRHGAVLLRGFEVGPVERFERFAESLCGELFDGYGDLPRGEIAGRVYTTTPYPPEERILFHNESSQMHQWPLKQFFYCIEPSASGGETPIVDGRRVYRELDPRIRELFAQKRLMYVRNFIAGLDVGLEEFFGTNDKEEIERVCRAAGMETVWSSDTELQTRRICPGVAHHPKTSEPVFFNQIQAHHSSFLKSDVRESLLSMFGEDRLPRNVFYGDGTPIDEADAQSILEIYDRLAVSFTWQPGDVLMVDNMLCAHSRNPYQGYRKIVVAMGEMQPAASFLDDPPRTR